MKDKIPLLIFIMVALIFAPILLTATPLEANNESTSLSLEPSEIEIPYLDLEEGSTLIPIKLKIYNVHNLREFSLSLDYDMNILEYIKGEMDLLFYNTVGGWRGNEFRGRLSEAFSGSDTMFIYSFKVLRSGLTQIRFTNTRLIDESGSTIPHTISGCTVEVLSLDEWIDGKYAELKGKYDALLVNYTEIKAECETIKSDYDSLNSSFTSLQTSYNDLQITYNSLKADYDSLKANHESLQIDYNSLKTSYDKLRTDYDGLKSSYDSLSRDYNVLESKYQLISELGELGTTRSLMYIFIITTVLFIAITVYSARRKLGKFRKWIIS